jgi:hypothetical protein
MSQGFNAVPKEWWDIVEEELDRKGVTEYSVRKGGRHLKLVFRIRGERFVTFLSGSPSDWRAARNIRSQLKRLVEYGKTGDPALYLQITGRERKAA